MSRRTQGKLSPLTRKERAVRKERNERRARSPRERRWEREHIVRAKRDPIHDITLPRNRTKEKREAVQKLVHTALVDRVQDAIAKRKSKKGKKS